MIYWILLLLAIIAEIIGTLSMKYASITGGMTGHMVMYIMIVGSYVLLSFAIKRVALGVAYALWEGLGLLLITLFSVILFGEGISPMKIGGIALLLTGIMLIKSGTSTGAKPGQEREETHAAA